MIKQISSLLLVAAFLVATAIPQNVSAVERERHPEIREAIRALERAKKHMEEAAHDFGGHREEAVKACDHALEQLRLALESDRK